MIMPSQVKKPKGLRSTLRSKLMDVEDALEAYKVSMDDTGSMPEQAIKDIVIQSTIKGGGTAKLFDRSGLDMNNTDHWKVLLCTLVEYLYVDRRGGKKPSWPIERQERILKEAYRIQREAIDAGKPQLKNEELGKALFRIPELSEMKTGKFKEKGKLDPDGLVSRLYEAITAVQELIESPFAYDSHDEADLLELTKMVQFFRPDWKPEDQ